MVLVTMYRVHLNDHGFTYIVSILYAAIVILQLAQFATSVFQIPMKKKQKIMIGGIRQPTKFVCLVRT